MGGAIKMNELETLLGYAERFLGRVRGSISLDEFRQYLRNLEEDVSSLTNADAALRVSQALVSIRMCDYVFRNHPEMKDPVVLPAVEKLVGIIKEELRRSPKQ